jgi:uncharacterized membrane protein HdeD (DUF308 family)
MSFHATPADVAAWGNVRRLWWPSLLLGLAAIAVGVAAFAWPDTTIRVVGVLFGLNLLITGLVRAGLCLVLPYPALYRVLGVVFGVLAAIVGIVCLRNAFASAVVLVLFVAIGWLLDGMIEIAAGLTGTDDPMRAWRVGVGLLYLITAALVLVWPALSLRTFLSVGAVALIVIGVAQVAMSIGEARTSHLPADPTAAEATP